MVHIKKNLKENGKPDFPREGRMVNFSSLTGYILLESWSIMASLSCSDPGGNGIKSGAKAGATGGLCIDCIEC